MSGNRERAALHRRPAESIFNDGLVKVLNDSDPSVGVLYVRESADMGYFPAMVQLADWYIDGTSILPKDGGRAIYWLSKGADRDDPPSMRRIGDIYRFGMIGVQRNEDRAAEWYLRAAEMGDVPAVISLWGMAESGSRSIDKVEVIPYLREAAARDDTAAMVLVGKEAIARGRRAEGFMWLRRAAAAGSVDAKREIGLRYVFEEDQTEKGIGILTAAADDGDAECQYRLGLIYAVGEKTEKDYKRALYWYRRASDQSYPEAENAVGEMYLCGLGAEKDYAVSMKQFRRASDHGCADAKLNIGIMFEKGLGVPTLYRDAAEWYFRAAEAGSVHAMVRIARMYEFGKGVPQSSSRAAEYLSAAAERGDASAAAELDRLNLI